MNRASILAILTSVILLFTACQPSEDFNFQGIWQSLNDEHLQIEIDENNNYTLYRDGLSLLSELAEYGQLKINIDEEDENWNSFRVEDELKKELTHGRIEIISNDRIRIYFHKHHDILDLADEFHRANDFVSFSEIMSQIVSN